MPLASGWGYYFHPPSWARASGCPAQAEPLGTDYEAAVKRAETVLLPAFDSWRGGGASNEAKPDTHAKAGTLNWLFAQYRGDRRFTKLPSRSQRNAEAGMRLVGDHAMNDGRKLGTVPLAKITAAVVDAVYDRLLTVKKNRCAGQRNRVRAPDDHQ
jgi:hypothetical protein